MLADDSETVVTIDPGPGVVGHVDVHGLACWGGRFWWSIGASRWSIRVQVSSRLWFILSLKDDSELDFVQPVSEFTMDIFGEKLNNQSAF